MLRVSLETPTTTGVQHRTGSPDTRVATGCTLLEDLDSRMCRILHGYCGGRTARHLHSLLGLAAWSSGRGYCRLARALFIAVVMLLQVDYPDRSETVLFPTGYA